MRVTRARSQASADQKDLHLQLLDDTWLLTIFAVLLAIALPWFANGFEVDIATVFLGAITLGAIHLALTAETWLGLLSAVWRKRALGLLHAIGVVVIGIIWHHAGGPQNPAFLLAFALPVLGASFISRSFPYLTAALAVLVVAAVALSQAAELRWYFAGLGGAGAWLATLFADATDIGTPFRGFYAPYGFWIVMLEAFAVLLFACAVAAEHLGGVFERLYVHVESARAEAAQGQELWTTMIEHLPVPALLVEPDTLRVICASEHLERRFRPAGTRTAGLGLFEALRFSYPDMVQELVNGTAGDVRPGMIHVGDELRSVAVGVQHVEHRGQRLALVVLDDLTEQFCAQSALDAADHATLVVDWHGRIVAFNKPARELFAGTELGTASRLLSQTGPAAQWWQPGLAGRRKMHVQVAGRICEVTSSVVPLPGEEKSFYVIAFRATPRLTATHTTDASAPVEGDLVTS
jgi:PAS domain-containing protein